MTPEERNHTMNTSGILGPAGQHIVDSTNVLQAIRECDRKARAWDALEEWLNYQDAQCPTMSVKLLLFKMSSLLAPPKPKSKLERLREWARKNNRDSLVMLGHIIDYASLLKEIDRLESEPESTEDYQAQN